MQVARGFRGMLGVASRPPRADSKPQMDLMNADTSTKLDLIENDGGVK